MILRIHTLLITEALSDNVKSRSDRSEVLMAWAGNHPLDGRGVSDFSTVVRMCCLPEILLFLQSVRQRHLCSREPGQALGGAAGCK